MMTTLQAPHIFLTELFLFRLQHNRPQKKCCSYPIELEIAFTAQKVALDTKLDIENRIKEEESNRWYVLHVVKYSCRKS